MDNSPRGHGGDQPAHRLARKAQFFVGRLRDVGAWRPLDHRSDGGCSALLHRRNRLRIRAGHDCVAGSTAKNRCTLGHRMAGRSNPPICRRRVLDDIAHAHRAGVALGHRHRCDLDHVRLDAAARFAAVVAFGPVIAPVRSADRGHRGLAPVRHTPRRARRSADRVHARLAAATHANENAG